MASCIVTKDVHAVQTAYRTVQEIAKLLRANEEDNELKIFYADLTAYCAIIRDHWNRINNTAVRIHHQLCIRLLAQLERIVTPDIFVILQITVPINTEHQSAILRALDQHWDELRKHNNDAEKIEAIRRCLVLGATAENRNEFIKALCTCEEDIRKMYPEDPSEWTVDDFAPQRKIREPPYEVWNAAQAVFKALAACRGCICHPVHEFGARLCLSTYRKPYVGTDVGIDDDMFDFDMFISMMQEWHETCVHTAKEAVVQFTIDDDISQTQPKKKGPVNKPMKVKRLCEPIAKIKTMTSYRLELKVTKGQLFKLQSQRSKSLFDITKDSISLKQILEGKSRSFTEKTRRILAVILSSAVLHLVDTPWLQPVWSSTNVLFLRTASEAIPLRPFIQIPLSNGERGNCIEHQSGSEDIPSNERAQLPDYNSDDIDPDDIDPDDLVGHQCLIVISLAVMLMEVYFATPFHDLASRFGIELGEDAEFRSCTRYLDTTLVFEACRGEIPENFQFLYAIEKCLDPTIWEDAGGNRLDSQTLRTRIYEEVVRPLETELSQAYSSISIDDLDRFALGLDLASWDRTIQPWIQQPHAETPRGHAQDFSRTSSPSSQLTSSYHSQNYLPLHSRLQQLDPFELGHQPVPSSHFDHPYNILPKLAHVATGESDNKSLKFFDDETISEAHSYQARSNYANWRSRYLEVYEKFIPSQGGSSPVKIAILDTGIDLTHPDVDARMENIKGKLNWLHEKHRQMVHDRNGHGTFTANLLLDYAPDAELYIAKIAENKPSSPKIIAEAINYAVSQWQVDIISMSFGFPTCVIEDYGELERALKNAYLKDVLLFAAASNNGGRLGRSFPSREPTVIAIHATDTNGNRSGFSPTATDDDLNLATVGEAVESAWPVYLCNEAENPTFVKYKSGTSYATPIAAGIAAFLLRYVRTHLPAEAYALKSQKRMKALLKKVAEKGIMYKPRDGYHFVDLSLYRDSLFGKDKAYIDQIMVDVLCN